MVGSNRLNSNDKHLQPIVWQSSRKERWVRRPRMGMEEATAQIDEESMMTETLRMDGTIRSDGMIE